MTIYAHRCINDGMFRGIGSMVIVRVGWWGSKRWRLLLGFVNR